MQNLQPLILPVEILEGMAAQMCLGVLGDTSFFIKTRRNANHAQLNVSQNVSQNIPTASPRIWIKTLI